MKTKRLFVLLMCFALLTALLAGCGGNAGAMDSGGNYSPGQSSGNLTGSGSESSGNNLQSDRKLIRKIQMEAETEDMDSLLQNIGQRIEELGGYVESRNVQNGSKYNSYSRRYATLVIRIPSEKLDSFVEHIGEESNIVSTTETSDDVTLQYVDTESRLKVLRTEEERLLEFLSKAETVSEMLQIEERLTEIQTQIESVTSQLKTYDNLVDYGTVTLEITEVEVYTQVEEEEPTMWEEIAEGFMNSVDSLLAIGRALVIFFLARSPYLLLIAVIIGVILLVIRAIDRRQRRKRAMRTPPAPPTPPAQRTDG